MTSETGRFPVFPIPDPELYFLLSEEKVYDYSNLFAFCNWFQAETESLGISPERPLAILSRSTDQVIFVVAACWFLRIPFISLSPDSSDEELKRQLEQLNIPLILTDATTTNRTHGIPELVIPPEVLQEESDADMDIISSGAPEEIFGYFPTSGSTGYPKIVPLKRRQALFAARASEKNFKPDKDFCWLLCLPLNHIGGISVIIRCLLYNAAIYRMEKFDSEKAAAWLSDNKLFQAASMVPTMLVRLLRDKKFHVHREFKAILLGGGPITMSLIREAGQRGVPIVTSYGMTETFGQIAANSMLKPSGIYIPKTSVGMIFRPNDIEIRSEGGMKLPANESGVIWLKGPQIFDGYLDRSLNRSVIDKEGWFNTGDFGHLNRQNLLFIESRRSDVIITGGENVNPVEVEEALESLESITEAAVTGVEDEEWGQRIIAFVTVESDSINQDQIKNRLKSRLSSFKIPREIIVISSIPKTGPGKINRNRLAELYQERSRQAG